MPARTQEIAIGIGFKKQTGTGGTATTPTQLQTALSAGDLWSLGLGSFQPPFPDLKTEDDGEFFGKGDEFVTQLFPTSIDAPWQWDHFLTSQNFAQLIAFAVHNITATTPASGAYQYVCSPMIPATHGVNLPATTVVVGIRQGTGGEILDMAMIGMVCNSFTIRLQRGPGLQNATMASSWLGCGKFSNDSGIAVPSAHTESRLGAGASTALLVNGVDYLSNARFVDMEYEWSNNIVPDSGYFPGSGQQSNYDIRGRMRYGRRTQRLNATVELESSSTELAQLIAGTEGNSELEITGPLITGSTYHTARIEWPRTRIKAFAMGEADGFTTARLEVSIMKDATDGPVIFTAITDKQNIGAAA